MNPTRSAGTLAGLRQLLENSWRPGAGHSKQRLVVVQANTLICLIDLWEYLGHSAEEILRRSYERLDAIYLEAFHHPGQGFDNSSRLLLQSRLNLVQSWCFEIRSWLCDRELETLSDPQRVANGVELLNRLVPFWPFLVRRELCLKGVTILDQVFRYSQSGNSADTLDRVVEFLRVEPGPMGYTHWWLEARGFSADYTDSNAERDRRQRALGRLWWDATVKQRLRLISLPRFPTRGLIPQLPVEIHDIRNQTVFGNFRNRCVVTGVFPFNPEDDEADVEKVIERDVIVENCRGFDRWWRVRTIRCLPDKGFELTLRRIRPV